MVSIIKIVENVQFILQFIVYKHNIHWTWIQNNLHQVKSSSEFTVMALTSVFMSAVGSLDKCEGGLTLATLFKKWTNTSSFLWLQNCVHINHPREEPRSLDFIPRDGKKSFRWLQSPLSSGYEHPSRGWHSSHCDWLDNGEHHQYLWLSLRFICLSCVFEISLKIFLFLSTCSILNRKWNSQQTSYDKFPTFAYALVNCSFVVHTHIHVS